MLRSSQFSSGDTLIEVLFAITVFSLVAVGTLSIMNQGTATVQRALEITLVNQEINSQAETLRFLNSSYAAAYQAGATYLPGTPADRWSKMMGFVVGQASYLNGVSALSPKCVVPGSGSFIFDTHDATYYKKGAKPFNLAPTYARAVYNVGGPLKSADGIWIEATQSPASMGPKSVDFHIRACWESPGQSAPITLGTIVRLYAPGL